ncbi:DUF4349 domain-containing protein [Nocardioides marmotae]|uniref:DUF4349 domain-containing protein n=1 Tax=Nocardioides marmotae TaxID=2663857 RepID=UPI0012B608B1|nr:DUF4349 domain-containing protein [Nocardioides marmotae]MBC9734566.1 DUF4349 domain-containing protein [Nocardioides marmotae]MTB85667.1 DUF4349 domain-containing protein [Nocardioides marmotae]
MTTYRRAGHRVAAALVTATTLAALAALTGCGGGASDSDSSGSTADVAASSGSDGGEAPAAAAREANGFVADDAASSAAVDAVDAASARKVISTGNVALRADDVGEARFEVQKVVDRYGGEVAEEQTATDDDGEVKRSRLVLRVPSDRFDDAVESLKGAAELVTAGTTSEDVTTKVLDVDIRVRVQRRSIRRVELLLDRAQSIRDIVAIEAQLSRRQAALASLEKQQDYLADQTAMSTITVSLERTPREPAAAQADDDAGFLSGLSAGWHGLVTTALAVATVAGALLPFLAAGLLLGLPAWLLLKRLRRRPVAAD